MRSQKLTKGIGDALFLECNQLVLDSLVIIGEADKGCLDALAAVKAGKFIITESAGQLTCTVRTEVRRF